MDFFFSDNTKNWIIDLIQVWGVESMVQSTLYHTFIWMVTLKIWSRDRQTIDSVTHLEMNFQNHDPYLILTKFGPWGVIEPLIPSPSLDQIIALMFWILNIWQENFQFYKHTFSSNSILAFLCWNIILTSTRLRKKIEPMC